MDFQLSYFPISICIVFSKNWFVTFGTWTQSSFLWFFFFVCFEKPVIFFCLSSLTFTGRKRIYQQGRKQTQSWQYLHNTLPPPPISHKRDTRSFLLHLQHNSIQSFLKVQRKPEHSASIQFLQLSKQSLILCFSGLMAGLPLTWRRQDWACTKLTLLQH